MERTFSKNETEAWQERLHRVSANAVVILHDGKGRVLVVKANYKTYSNFPGGSVDKGESPKQAAIREVREEIGVDLDAEDLEFVAFIYQHNSSMESYKLVFESPITREQVEAIMLLEAEIESYDFVTKDQVLSEDRQYAPAVMKWARGALAHYDEHRG